MNLDTFICEYSGKKIKASKAYKIRDNDSIEHVVLVNRACYNADVKNCEACQNCHGTVCQSIRKIKNEKGAIKTVKNTRVDRFIETQHQYINLMDASNFLADMEISDIINEPKNLMNQLRNEPWVAYMWPSTYKTDCHNCKIKYENREELTPCQKATKYYNELGINLKYASEKDILAVDLPEQCVCREQKQQKVYV